jgi:hypothetical protein
MKITTDEYPVINTIDIPIDVKKAIYNISIDYEMHKGFQLFENPTNDELDKYDKNFVILSTWLRENDVTSKNVLIDIFND